MNAEAPMRVTILGSGTAVPRAERFPAGVLVETGTTRVCVDLGPGVLRRLAAIDVGPVSIDAVLLTHYHTDHCADLAALLFALRHPDLARRPPLTLLGAPGLRRVLDGLALAWPWTRPKDYELRVLEVAPGRHEVGDLEVQATSIVHTDASLAYRLRDPSGAVVTISGDAAGCPGLTEAARGAHLFVCESSTPDGAGLDGHLTPGQAATHAREAGVGMLCLTHFYPECEGVDVVAQAAAVFDGPIHAARDLLRFDLDGETARVAS